MSYYRARYERKQKNREDMFDRYKGYGLIRGCMVTEQEQAEWAFEEKDYEFEEFQNYGGKAMTLGFMVLQSCCIGGALSGNKMWLATSILLAALAIWAEQNEAVVID